MQCVPLSSLVIIFAHDRENMGGAGLMVSDIVYCSDSVGCLSVVSQYTQVSPFGADSVLRRHLLDRGVRNFFCGNRGSGHEV